MIRLEPEGTGAAAEGLVDERQRFGDLLVIPAATILLFEKDEVVGIVEAGVAPRIVQQYEGRPLVIA